MITMRASVAARIPGRRLHLVKRRSGRTTRAAGCDKFCEMQIGNSFGYCEPRASAYNGLTVCICDIHLIYFIGLLHISCDLMTLSIELASTLRSNLLRLTIFHQCVLWDGNCLASNVIQ
ncbi:unnamed protein product [Amoebophrya sp. A25]|nr:unnamed protein product [Amoebophrya sp. A25]|eukprot:GSA25T00024993001.1